MNTTIFYKYPKIHAIKDSAKDIINLGGNFVVNYTEKLHGTNSAIVLTVRDSKIESYYAQSRNRVLSEEEDNYGFYKFVYEEFQVPELISSIGSDYDLIIYGEWVGKGIQHGVGLSDLETRYFVIFDIHVAVLDTSVVVPLPEALRLQMIYKTTICNEKVHSVVNRFEGRVIVKNNDLVGMVDQLQSIANTYALNSPMSAFLGKEGRGEGIVCTIPNTSIIFKIKGDDYSNRTNEPKTTFSKEVGVSIEVIDFINQERLDQGIAYLKEMLIPLELKSIPLLLEYSMKDMEEEYGSPFTFKEKKYISNRIVTNYKEYLNNIV